jgi:hypothetical protein
MPKLLLLIAIEPFCQLVLELTLAQAADVVGIGDFDHRLVAAHRRQGFDVDHAPRIIAAHQHLERQETYRSCRSLAGQGNYLMAASERRHDAGHLPIRLGA